MQESVAERRDESKAAGQQMLLLDLLKCTSYLQCS